MPTKTIKVDNLARVEGEGALYVRIRDGQLTDIRFRIFEPPRFFEALLRGRKFSEAPDITARICGICPVAYQMSAVHAMERAAGVTVGGQLRELRRLLYCGEWIESHALHIYLLHAPDFLGYTSGIELARDHADIVQRGLNLKKVGNAILAFARRTRGASDQRARWRILSSADQGRAEWAARAAEGGTRGGARDGALGGNLRYAGLRAGLRAGLVASPGRVPDERRSVRLVGWT